MVLLNQLDVSSHGGHGDVTLFCRNLPQLAKTSGIAQKWNMVSQGKSIDFDSSEQSRRNQLESNGIVIDQDDEKRRKLDLLVPSLQIGVSNDKYCRYSCTRAT